MASADAAEAIDRDVQRHRRFSSGEFGTRVSGGPARRALDGSTSATKACKSGGINRLYALEAAADDATRDRVGQAAGRCGSGGRLLRRGAERGRTEEKTAELQAP